MMNFNSVYLLLVTLDVILMAILVLLMTLSEVGVINAVY